MAAVPCAPSYQEHGARGMSQAVGKEADPDYPRQAEMPRHRARGHRPTGEPSIVRDTIRTFRRERNSQMVPQEGLEPPTPSLRMTCSTN